MKHKTLFKRAQSVETLGKYVMITVQVAGIEKFSPERKEHVRSKMHNLFTSLSGHPNYLGCFERGKTFFDDYAFGLACEEQYAEALKKTLIRFIKSYNFDTIMACGHFETMTWSKEDTEYYGGYLYHELLNAHLRGGIGRNFYSIVQGTH